MLKRLCDIVISFTLLVLFWPVAGLLACVIWLKMGGPIFFCQTRPGRYGRPFRMIKFRTMMESVDANDQPLADAARLTPLGRFLRASSLDELPEIWNVFIGDMSLVGPRPLLTEYLPLYSDEQQRRHEMRPGITGWAQVNGRNAISWEEKFKLDIWYVDNHTLWLDLKILCLTIRRVWAREGISAEGEATMSRFTGKDKERS